MKSYICGNGGFIFALDLGAIFLGILNFKILRFRIFFLNLGPTGILEKCVGCFAVYLFLGAFFIKKYKTMYMGGGGKNCIVTYEMCIYWCEKGISE